MMRNKKRTKRTVNKIVKNTIREFCSNTTVHGFRYFTEENLSWIERSWWFVSIAVLIVVCTITTMHIWSNWQQRPVIVNFDDKTTSIGTIPFPAVTICSTQIIDKIKLDVIEPRNKIKLFEMNKSNINLTSDDVSNINLVVQLCDLFALRKYSRNFTIPRGSIYRAIKSISPNVNGYATMNQTEVSIYPIFTQFGFCYTFNSLNSRDIYSDEVATELLTVNQNPRTNWNMETGYGEISAENEIFPKRIFGTNSNNILTWLLMLYSDSITSECAEDAKYYFALHAPDELPRDPEDFMLIQINQESRVAVSPVVMKTSNGLRRYSPESRGCFFKSERKLRFFRAYSRNNCELECLANYTQNACKCTPFFLPRNNATRECTMFDFNCYSEADDHFANYQDVEKCNCLPDCTSVSYNGISSQADLLNEKTNPTSNGERRTIFSALTVLYKQSYFMGMTRSETSTTADFIASFGGLLGLFMGVSILSVVELVYYFTLRLFFRVRRERSNRIKQVAPISIIPRLTKANSITHGLDRRNVGFN